MVGKIEKCPLRQSFQLSPNHENCEQRIGGFLHPLGRDIRHRTHNRWRHFTQSQRAIHFALQRLAHHHGMERRLTQISSHRGHGHAVHLLPKRRQQRG